MGCLIMKSKKQKKKNLTFNVTKLYSFIALMFLMGAIFFGTSKMFFAEELPIQQTPINEELELKSNGKMTINKWVYDKNKEKMEVILITNGIKDYKNELSFSSVTREETNKELPVDVVYNDNEIYIIQIDQVKEEFKQIALRLYKHEKNTDEIFNKESNINIIKRYKVKEEYKQIEIRNYKNEKKTDEIFNKESNKKDKEKDIFSTIYTDERKVEMEEISEKNTSDYVEEVTNGLIDETESDIKNQEEEIEKKEYTIGEIDKEIEELENDLLYETVDEQVDTNHKIENLKKEIKDYEKEIEENKTNISNMEKKIERLEQRKQDINYN